MNLNQLKQVIAVADEGNFTKAAQKLFISQPSLSKSIKFLENEIGIELFERNPIKLTYAGDVFVNRARKIISEIEEMEIEISDISSNNKTRLVVGVPSHRCDYFIPRILKDLHKEFPNCFIKIEEYPTHLLKSMIEEDKVDLFIGPESPDNINYIEEHICSEGIYLSYPKSWGIKTKENEISLKEFEGKNFIFFSEELTFGIFERKLCEEFGVNIASLVECHNVETVYSMIREGLGVSLLPELFVKFLPQDNLVEHKKIKGLNYKRNLSIFYKKDKYLIKPAKRFIELFRLISEK